MNPGICIREYRSPEDYQACIELWNSIEKGIHVGASDAPDEILKKVQRDPDLFLVAEADGLIIGTVIGGFDGRRGAIYHLAVQSAFRGQGIAGQLMSAVESRLRSKGCIRCYLFVTPDNPEAMQYYEKHGWSAMKVRPYAKDLV